MNTYVGRRRGRPRSDDGTAEIPVVQSVDRAIGVLKTVAAGDGLTLTDIAKAATQSPSTVYRILITLHRRGMLEFDDATQLWYIGLEAFCIGRTFLGRTSIVEQSRTVMQDVMTKTGETTNLAIVDGDEVVFVSQVETNELICAFFRSASRGPVHASGIGKAILAFFPKAQVDTTLRQTKLVAYTDRTITEKPNLLEELAKIRERGWSVDDEENTTGMRCIAAPIFNEYRAAIAGISLSGPSFRVTPQRDDELGQLISDAAREITKAIGGRLPKSLRDVADA